MIAIKIIPILAAIVPFSREMSIHFSENSQRNNDVAHVMLNCDVSKHKKVRFWMPNIPDTLITSYLELYPDEFKPAFITDDRMLIQQVIAPDIRYYRFMYSMVGEQWNWTDRLLLEDDDLLDILQDPNMSMYVLYFEGAPAGYIELVRRSAETTEIKYFGLREEFWGMGLGKHLLSFGVAQAVEDGSSHIILDTCNLDGPHALKNYTKRGFTVYKVTHKPMPDKEFIKLTARQRGLY